jgi:hypothetical protein
VCPNPCSREAPWRSTQNGVFEPLFFETETGTSGIERMPVSVEPRLRGHSFSCSVGRRGRQNRSQHNENRHGLNG